MESDILSGDCRELLPCLPDNTYDAIVTDPPYELGFMGKKWDSTGIAYDMAVWAECLRVLKPGGHMLAFGGTRTYHRMTCAIEDAGFEIRDCLQWLYGTGFPKSLNVAKAIQTGGRPEDGAGWGTALKPANEPIVLARKPLQGTVAENFHKWGTGALNIDACRIGTSKRVPTTPRRAAQNSAYGDLSNAKGDTSGFDANVGRWPANLLLDEDAAALLDAQSGIAKPKVARVGKRGGSNAAHMSREKGDNAHQESDGYWPSDAGGGASRFFYVAKASRAERDAGIDGAAKLGGELTNRKEGSAGLNNPRAGAGRTSGGKNDHPTVKPIELMRYLVRLITPPGGTVLDPFTGSGTTGIAAVLEGFNFQGIEMSDEYADLARQRIEHWTSAA